MPAPAARSALAATPRQHSANPIRTFPHLAPPSRPPSPSPTDCTATSACERQGRPTRRTRRRSGLPIPNFAGAPATRCAAPQAERPPNAQRGTLTEVVGRRAAPVVVGQQVVQDLQLVHLGAAPARGTENRWIRSARRSCRIPCCADISRPVLPRPAPPPGLAKHKVPLPPVGPFAAWARQKYVYPRRRKKGNETTENFAAAFLLNSRRNIRIPNMINCDPGSFRCIFFIFPLFLFLHPASSQAARKGVVAGGPNSINDPVLVARLATFLILPALFA